MSDTNNETPTVIRRIVESDTNEVFVSIKDIIDALRNAANEYRKFADGEDENYIAGLAVDHIAGQFESAMLESILEDTDVQPD